jgi:hypothetical protein
LVLVSNMDICLTESESKYYNDLFSLCDVEKVGKVPKLKSDEFFRSAEEIEEETLIEVSLWPKSSINCTESD